MKQLLILLLSISLISCNPKTEEKQVDHSIVLQQLKDLGEKESKFIESFILNPGKLPQQQLEAKRDSFYASNCLEVKEIFSNHGFLGIDKVGEEGAHNFSLVVIHCFADNEFQLKVLKEMEAEFQEGNVSPTDYATLVDKQKIHNNEKQVYGTQITTLPSMWIIPDPLIDSLNVNKRRAEIGLNSIEEYLNGAMKTQFEWNKEAYKQMGILEPFQYE